jgi:hypothetical protein
MSEIMVEASGKALFYFTPDSENIPVHPLSRIYIVGEMTKGQKIELTKMQIGSNEVYGAYINVRPGYKYAFCFVIDDIITTDAYYPTYIGKVGYIYAIYCF